jgi:hypothetical protein
MINKGQMLAAVTRLPAAALDRLGAPLRSGSRFPHLMLAQTAHPSGRGTDAVSRNAPVIPAIDFMESSINSFASAAVPGDIAEIRDATRRLCGYGVWDGVSKLHAFHYLNYNATAAVTVDEAYWRQRLRHALDCRLRLLPPLTTAYRAVDGLRDGVPGILIDVFGHLIVIRVEAEYALPLFHTCASFMVQEIGVGACVYAQLPDGLGHGATMVSPNFSGHCHEATVSLPSRVDRPDLMFETHHRAVRQHIRDLVVDKRVAIAGDPLGATAANALVGSASRLVVLESRGDDARRALQDTLQKTQMSGRAYDVVDGTLRDFAPQTAAGASTGGEYDVVVLGSSGLSVGSRAADSTDSNTANHEAPIAEQLQAAERLVRPHGLVVLMDRLRRPEPDATDSQALRGHDTMVHGALRFAASTSSRRNWRLVKGFRVAVDHPVSGLWPVGMPHAAIFEVSRR